LIYKLYADFGRSSKSHAERTFRRAKQFVEARLLHRDLKISLHGTDKSGICPVGTIHHPKGSIGVELLKNGLARVSDWSSRILNPLTFLHSVLLRITQRYDCGNLILL
jgi:hypothetical protein